MNVERRQNRSSFTSIALTRWLDAVAAQNALEGVVLADACGLLVAHGAMDVDRAEAVAAIACLTSESTDELAIHRFEYEGDTLFLCGLGRKRTPNALHRAKNGVQRILDERVAA
jgi:hypothetical protein